jgi:hypothetical protein
MRQITMMMFMFLSMSMFAQAGFVFDFVPSAQTTNVNGIEFSPLGGDLVVTNTLVSERSSSLGFSIWTDFRVVYSHTDAVGNVFYTPNNLAYQVYVLDQYLTNPPGPTPGILVRDLIDGTSEARNLGSGRYEFKANTIGGAIDFTFNTNLELGHQVEFGTLTYNGNSTPEPSSLLLVGMGISVIGLCRKFWV